MSIPTPISYKSTRSLKKLLLIYLTPDFGTVAILTTDEAVKTEERDPDRKPTKIKPIKDQTMVKILAVTDV